MLDLTPTIKQHLLELARKSIQHGLQFGQPASPEKNDTQGILGNDGASFVTLRIKNQLRGCIGSLVARRSLVVDVLENAFASAFRDPRFKPLHSDEYERLEIKISVLGSPQPMVFHSEADLLRQLQPGVDGLILIDGMRRGTFLPSVWEELSSPDAFLNHLKRKAGLPMDYWSSSIKVERYITEEFGE